MSEILSIDRISKRFGAVAALQDVSLSLQSGEVRAICGENGAGKSTLVKILMGIQQPDAGSMSSGYSCVIFIPSPWPDLIRPSTNRLKLFVAPRVKPGEARK